MAEMVAGMQAIVDRLTEQLPARVGHLMQTHTDRIIADARASAPVKTGRWKGSIRKTVNISGNNIRIGVSVGAGIPYEKFVKFARTAPSGYASSSAWQALMRKPMRAAAKDIITEAGPELLRVARGG